MALSEFNKISIVEICFYVPALVGGFILARRHGFGRSSGWFFLLILSLTRIVGAAIELATINSPSTSLYVTADILQSVGLSPLVLVMLGLLQRVYHAIQPEQRRPQLPNPRLMRLLQLLVLVGLILSIAGGSISSQNIDGNNISSYKISPLSKAGIVLISAGFVLVQLSALRVATSSLPYIPRGETRLLGAIAAAAPFVLVRLIFALLCVFDSSNPKFSAISGGTQYINHLLGMGIVMEFIAVVIFEVVGFTLPYGPYTQPRQQVNSSDTENPDSMPRDYRMQKPEDRRLVVETV